jgi:hypothetical protein
VARAGLCNATDAPAGSKRGQIDWTYESGVRPEPLCVVGPQGPVYRLHAMRKNSQDDLISSRVLPPRRPSRA